MSLFLSTNPKNNAQKVNLYNNIALNHSNTFKSTQTVFERIKKITQRKQLDRIQIWIKHWNNYSVDILIRRNKTIIMRVVESIIIIITVFRTRPRGPATQDRRSPETKIQWDGSWGILWNTAGVHLHLTFLSFCYIQRPGFNNVSLSQWVFAPYLAPRGKLGP
jgi:hypothetical protein